MKALREACRVPNVGRLFAVYFIYSTAFSCIEQVLGLFIERHWLFDKIALGQAAKPAAAMTAEMLMLVGITATIVQEGLIGKLVARFGEKRLLVTGVLCVAASFLVIILAGRYGNFHWMLANSVLMALAPGSSTRAPRACYRGRSMPSGRAAFSASAIVRGVGARDWGFSVPACCSLGSTELPFTIGAGLLLVSFFVALTVNAVGRTGAMALAVATDPSIAVVEAKTPVSPSEVTYEMSPQPGPKLRSSSADGILPSPL